MPPAAFQPTIPSSERPQTHALRPRDRWDRPSDIIREIKSRSMRRGGCALGRHKNVKYTGIFGTKFQRGEA